MGNTPSRRASTNKGENRTRRGSTPTSYTPRKEGNNVGIAGAGKVANSPAMNLQNPQDEMKMETVSISTTTTTTVQNNTNVPTNEEKSSKTTSEFSLAIIIVMLIFRNDIVLEGSIWII